ncbi:uncharacterized protein I303_106659 [Kwoniella dejecticola CBS 10117]|uniref:Thioesterase n=1 Tax=Kwoniella dejecticola CBS 10117 TaxID=1296121 RepID=A0A1A5ZU20_9TREE|nr:uncharacterized protein I303_08698 [Kwoniella dejecticola CBS 10117]OBR81312.1 hypothetical protein I303_08698 [Kwoniella dejecticola CBS 10117]
MATMQLITGFIDKIRTLPGVLNKIFPSSILDAIPKPVKYLAILLFVLHSPSWPFVWHARIIHSAIVPKIEEFRKGRLRYINEWRAAMEKRGGLRNYKLRYDRLAWFDDCDYRLHLSNSAYPKNCDPAELLYGMTMFAPLLQTGCFLALGARHYTFFKEIPVGAKYTVETRCGGWDEKWIYLVSEFIIYPKGKKSSDRSKRSNGNAIVNGSASASATATPFTPQSGGSVEMPKSKLEEIKKSWYLNKATREDGGVVCCVGISEMCIKMGRVTVPVRVGLWASMSHPAKDQQERAKATIMAKDKGISFLRGKWRDEPNAHTLGSDIYFDDVDAAGENWVTEARRGIEDVGRGMSVF